MNWNDICNLIAQGAIDLSTGHNIEPAGPTHRAMLALCNYIVKGNVKFFNTSEPQPLKTSQYFV